MQPLLGVAAFFLCNDGDRPVFELGHAGDDRRIVAEIAVAVDFLEIREQALQVIDGVRPFGVPRELDALPGWVRNRALRRVFLRTHPHILTGAPSGRV